uniref:Calcium-dependent protein kinase n=1 Tax=Chlamydomonas chlamydogama TaxID=225041 RepID=A0A7S2QUB8_9CHLO|mmetsp:Transcript_455/g.931  ORF Transcript_455/g.931 Transcript_455/m.931 type:complete len:540 (+) Transcript_455:2281-3900(+)
MGCGSSSSAGAVSIVDAKPAANGKGKGKGGKGEGGKSLNLGHVLEQTGDVRDYYTFDKVLGKGNFGVVHLVFDKKTGAPYACKSISKRKLLTPDDVEDVRREVQILLHLSGHKNIVQLYGAYEDKNYIHLVMECCAGGELFDRIAEKGHFSEKAGAEVMRTIVSVVNHCHTMNVIHRDLKPENFLLTSKGSDAVLKATDFGLSRFFKEGQLLDEIVGSPFYVAPEVLRRQYGQEADIWSCGVILYILLCGWPPFHGESTQQIFKHIMSHPLDLKSDPWPRISDAAKDLVRRMLCRDPKKRFTAEQVLKHPWMKEHGVATDEAFIPEVLTRLRTFAKMNKLKKEALKVIAKSLPTQELQGIKEMFSAIDEDNSGTITVDELREGLRKKGAALAFQEVAKIVDQIDVNGNQKIDYEEFLAATIHLNKLNREEVMVEAFKYFDKDNSGFITRDELEEALKEVGEDVSEVIDSILSAVDTNNDGKIDYEEFCAMMRNHDIDTLRSAATALKTKMVLAPKLSQSFTARMVEDELPENSAHANGH